MIEEQSVKILGPGPYGLRIKGGVEFKHPIVVTQVTPNGKADKAGIKKDFLIISVNGINFQTLTHSEAASIIKNTSSSLDIRLSKFPFMDPNGKLFNEGISIANLINGANSMKNYACKFNANNSALNCTENNGQNILKSNMNKDWYKNFINQMDCKKKKFTNNKLVDPCNSINYKNGIKNEANIYKSSKTDEAKNTTEHAYIPQDSSSSSCKLPSSISDKSSDSFKNKYKSNGEIIAENSNVKVFQTEKQNCKNSRVKTIHSDSNTPIFHLISEEAYMLNNNCIVEPKANKKIGEMNSVPVDHKSVSDSCLENKSNRKKTMYSFIDSAKIAQNTTHLQGYGSPKTTTVLDLTQKTSNSSNETNNLNETLTGKIKCFSHSVDSEHEFINTLNTHYLSDKNHYKKDFENGREEKLSNTPFPKTWDILENLCYDGKNVIKTNRLSTKSSKKCENLSRNIENKIKPKSDIPSSNSSSSMELLKNKIMNLVKSKKMKSKNIKDEGIANSKGNGLTSNEDPNELVSFEEAIKTPKTIESLQRFEEQDRVFLPNLPKPKFQNNGLHNISDTNIINDLHIDIKEETVKNSDLIVNSEWLPCFATVIHDFDGKYPGELTVPEGSRIHALKKIDVSWIEAEFKGVIGLVPISTISTFNEKLTSTNNYSHEIIGIGVALTTLTSRSLIAFSYNKDDYILINAIIDDKWFEVTLNNNRGIALRNNIQLLEGVHRQMFEPRKINMDVIQTSKKCSTIQEEISFKSSVAIEEEMILFNCEANQNYKPVSDDEISIEKGDIIFVTKYYSDGWGYGYNNRTSSTGMFPAFFSDIVVFCE